MTYPGLRHVDAVSDGAKWAVNGERSQTKTGMSAWAMKGWTSIKSMTSSNDDEQLLVVDFKSWFARQKGRRVITLTEPKSRTRNWQTIQDELHLA